MSNLVLFLLVSFTCKILSARLPHSNEHSSSNDDSAIGHNKEVVVTTVATTTLDLESTTMQHTFNDMDSVLYAELSEDGSMHVKPAATHVIDVSLLSDDLVTLTHIDRLTTKKNLESSQNQEMETTKNSTNSDSLKSGTNPELKSVTNDFNEFPDEIETTTCCYNFDITNKIVNFQSKTNQDIEVKILQPAAIAEFSKPEHEPKLKSLSGNSSEMNDPVKMISLIKLTRQGNANDEISKGNTTNLPMVSASIACLIVSIFLKIL
ncbi:unnamed protein product [Brugia pahangi]|uniref:Conserved secreted protein n=1 Tax=Brugia pahangi TaxID=6280 RepID=A0A0N4TRZ2_BRUPA|nr:unnamed protein product [Brugia pahangi]